MPPLDALGRIKNKKIKKEIIQRDRVVTEVAVVLYRKFESTASSSCATVYWKICFFFFFTFILDLFDSSIHISIIRHINFEFIYVYLFDIF